MQFVFNGTLEELTETVHIKAKEYGKDIIIYNNPANVLEIGFERLGHSDGRFFIADITQEASKTILNGEFKDVSQNQSKSKVKRILSEITEYLLAYFLLEIILIIPWIFLKNIINLWVLLLLPVIYLIIRFFLNKKEENKTDNGFVEFLALCTVYPFEQQNWYDVYKRLNLAQGKLQSLCDDREDMLLITYEDGMQIHVGYTNEDKTYCITIVKDEDAKSSNTTLGKFATADKSNLPTELQKAILKFRNT